MMATLDSVEDYIGTPEVQADAPSDPQPVEAPRTAGSSEWSDAAWKDWSSTWWNPGWSSWQWQRSNWVSKFLLGWLAGVSGDVPGQREQGDSTLTTRPSSLAPGSAPADPWAAAAAAITAAVAQDRALPADSAQVRGAPMDRSSCRFGARTSRLAKQRTRRRLERIVAGATLGVAPALRVREDDEKRWAFKAVMTENQRKREESLSQYSIRRLRDFQRATTFGFDLPREPPRAQGSYVT